MTAADARVSRRTFLSANATVLASIGLGGLLDGTPAQAAAGSDLARHRPVRVSSTAYAATPAEFAVDDLQEVGVRGSGWRAGTGDPQWIEVDLQATCRVEAVTLTFEAKPGDPAWVPGTGINPYDGTTGFEVFSSYPTAFEITVSTDGSSYTSVYRTTQGTGAVSTITLAAPVTARYVRMTSTARSTTNPLGLNGLQILGTTTAARPAATGWTDWGSNTDSAPALQVAADGTVPLESGWNLTYDSKVPGATGPALARAGVDTTAWLPATVPGTVLASLVEQGCLPDPAGGWGNLLVPEALSRHSWWYRREFSLPGGLATGGDRRIWLEFDGINHHAEIWLDGVRLGEMTHPFQRASFDVTAALATSSGLHALSVRMDPMPVPGNPGDRGPDGVAYRDAGADQMNLNTPTYLAVSGWDWMPAVRDRVTGIWNHVRLRSTGPVQVGDAGVRSVLPDATTADVTVTVPVRNSSGSAQSVTLQASFGGVTVQRTVSVAAGAPTDVVFSPSTDAALRVASPKLWWPNGYGAPNLYTLTLKATVGGTLSDQRAVKFGIRQVEYETTPGLSVPAGGSAAKTTTFARQTARYVRIQCDKRATGWGSSLFTVTVNDGSGADLALNRPATASSQDNADNGPEKAVDGNAGTRWSSSYNDNQWIQVDLGAAKGFDRVTLVWETAFASEVRVLVSDDGSTFRPAAAISNGATPLRIKVNGVPVFCRGGSWGWDELLRRALPDRLPAAVALHRDQGFTMIRAWIGCVTREELYAECDANGILVWSEFPSAFFLDPPDYDVFLAQSHDTVLRCRNHPSIVLWCAKNEGDPTATIDAAHRATVTSLTDCLYVSSSIAGPFHADGGYSWRPPQDYFSGSASGGRFGFHSEIGMPTVPVEESMRNLLGISATSTDGWPIGGAWYMHDWCANGGQNVTSYKQAIDDRLGASTSLGEFCRKAQLINFESMRALFEAWNARLWSDANGVLLWMSHPAWHSTVWQTYDYDLDVNGTYYGARSASEMVHVQANQPNWNVIVVNHTAAALTGVVVKAELYDLSGRSLAAAKEATVTVPASSVAAGVQPDWPSTAPAVHLLRLTLTDGSGKVLSRNTYWRYRAAGDLTALNSVATTSLRVTATRRNKVLTARVTNTGSTVAAMVRVSLRDRSTGARVTPAIYSENYQWLLPGEARDVIVTSIGPYPATKLGVSVEAYNAPRAKAAVRTG